MHHQIKILRSFSILHKLFLCLLIQFLTHCILKQQTLPRFRLISVWFINEIQIVANIRIVIDVLIYESAIYPIILNLAIWLRFCLRNKNSCPLKLQFACVKLWALHDHFCVFDGERTRKVNRQWILEHILCQSHCLCTL